jgi:uncharacterized membrane protein affecting hemolysin expression
MKRIVFFCLIFSYYVSGYAMESKPNSQESCDLYEMIHGYNVAKGLVKVTLDSEDEKETSNDETDPVGCDKLQ